ncbi:hypothetical protein EVD20_12180 [Elizabethkingia bruuniana]|nr:hypothetical protein EVD20_12180 [Elizabethkingia bruuniana]
MYVLKVPFDSLYRKSFQYLHGKLLSCSRCKQGICKNKNCSLL